MDINVKEKIKKCIATLFDEGAVPTTFSPENGKRTRDMIHGIMQNFTKDVEYRVICDFTNNKYDTVELVADIYVKNKVYDPTERSDWTKINFVHRKESLDPDEIADLDV